jgi:integrase
MSIYKPKNARFWHYDFQYKGQRFHGSTGQTDRNKAKTVEATRRYDAALGRSERPAITLDQAAQRWWLEKGVHLRSSEDVEARLELALTIIGADTLLSDVTSDVIARAVAKRQSQTIRGGKKPTNATVNRDIIDTLRPVLNRARKVWGIVGLPEINWRDLRLAEKKPTPHDFSDAEVEAYIAKLPVHWRDFARFQSRYGCRLAEMFFGLNDIDLDRGRIVLRNRKGGDQHTIPLLAGDLGMVRARVGRAKAANLDTIWFRELKSGKLKPLAYWGAQKALAAGFEATGLRSAKGARGSHDLRHHAAMRVLRATGNVRAAQKLLGHASIQSTLVYAHAVEDDVRAALEAAASRNSPEAKRGGRRKA